MKYAILVTSFGLPHKIRYDTLHEAKKSLMKFAEHFIVCDLDVNILNENKFEIIYKTQEPSVYEIVEL